MSPDRALGAYYLLDEPIGRGAMGEVWQGVVRSTGFPVAVKFLRPELASDPSIVARFLQERSILLSVHHANVVTVHDLVAEGETLAIVMDLVRGGDLRGHLRRLGRLAPGTVAGLSMQIAEGLAAVHAAGVIHRDLKPENVLLDEPVAGHQPRARISDFGIARMSGAPGTTRHCVLIGTPAYMAPELSSGQEPTPAVDIYAVGVMAYELASGSLPFVADHPMAVLRLHLEHRPEQPATIPEQLWSVVSACLEKRPEDRPTAGELRAALSALADDASLPAAESPPSDRETFIPAKSHSAVPVPPASKRSGRSSPSKGRWLAAGVAAALVSLWTGVGLLGPDGDDQEMKTRSANGSKGEPSFSTAPLPSSDDPSSSGDTPPASGLTGPNRGGAKTSTSSGPGLSAENAAARSDTPFPVAPAPTTTTAPSTTTVPSSTTSSTGTSQGTTTTTRASTDAFPCNSTRVTRAGRQVQFCPLWRANVPVYDSPDKGVSARQVGTLVEGGSANWFVGQLRRSSISVAGYANDWWAFTLADNGAWGWVPEVYFQGGADNERDAGLALCGAANPCTPGVG